MAKERRISEFDYELDHPFQYSHKGDQSEASFVRLVAPTSKHSKECAVLKQAFFVAIPKDAKGDDQKDVKVTGEDVLSMIAASKDVDLGEVYAVARKLFTTGVAFVDGEEKLTTHLVDRMDQSDFECMLGEYLVNFTLASTLRQTREPSSPGS